MAQDSPGMTLTSTRRRQFRGTVSVYTYVDAVQFEVPCVEGSTLEEPR